MGFFKFEWEMAVIEHNSSAYHNNKTEDIY